MCSNNQDNSRNQHPCLMVDIKLFQDQENKSRTKQCKGQQAMMMFFITMIKRVRANTKGQQNHSYFKPIVMDDVNTKERQAAKKEWQQGTMNGAGQ